MDNKIKEVYKNLKTLSDIEFKQYIKDIDKELCIQFTNDLVENDRLINVGGRTVMRAMTLVDIAES